MVRERGFSPVAALVHAIAIAAGAFLGFLAMGAIAPDLPAQEVAPGVSSSVAPEEVAGGDADSLFLESNLGPALDQLAEQTAAGQGVLRLLITPGSLEAQTASGDGLIDAADVPARAPEIIARQAIAHRPQVSLEQFSYFELLATDDGLKWYAQLDPSVTKVDPPWTYTAPLAGTPAKIGAGVPRPLDAEPEQSIAPPPTKPHG